MDPLHKTDSAISVASKDNGVYNHPSSSSSQLPGDDYPPLPQPQQSSRSSHAQPERPQQHRPPSPTAGPTVPCLPKQKSPAASSSTLVTQAGAPAQLCAPPPPPPLLPLPLPLPSGNKSSPSPAPTSAAPAPAAPPSPAASMENLVSPLDAEEDGAGSSESRPPYIDQPSADWYEAGQLRRLSPPQPSFASHAADPSTAEDGEQEDHDGRPGSLQQETLDALTQSGTGAIDVDHDQLELESDPGYGSDTASFASTSLSSSVRDYLFENGRRYHRFREGRYNFPNDEAEQDREDMKHACVKMLCQDKLYFAPIDEDKGNSGGPQNILDIGTGTGIWAIEMGDEFPSANVVGIDLSPIQPDWVPANVHFVVDDAESEWVYPPNHFDYIHTRHTVMGIKDWPKLYRTALEHLRPGGWMESQEIYHYPISANNSMPPDHPVAQYWGLIHEGLRRLGINFDAAAGGKIAAMMRDAGFVNVQEQILHVPLGTWAKHPLLKRVGEYWRHILLVGAQAIALGPLTRGCGWTREQVEVFLIEVRKAYYDNSCLGYMPMYVTYGQKPEH